MSRLIRFEEINGDCVLIGKTMYLFNGVFDKVTINGEVFDFNDLSDNTVVSDKGTTGRLSTDHASGMTYINEVMWNEQE